MKRELTKAEKQLVDAVHHACQRTTWLPNGAVSVDYTIRGETRTIIASDVLACCLYIKAELEASHA